VFTVKNIFFALIISGCNVPAWPSFEPFTDATTSGGTAYTAGSGLYHQTNALGDGWAQWKGPSGSATAQVACINSGLNYSGFPAGFPAPPAAAVTLPGSAVALSGYSAALQFSKVITADSNNLATNKIYASFLLQISSIGNLDSANPIYFGGFATNSGDQSVSTPSRAIKLYLRGSGTTPGSSSSYALGIQTANGTGNNAAYDGGGHVGGDVLFVVFDYEFGVNGAPDVGNLWVNPAPASFGAALPPTPTASFSTSTAAAQLVNAADFYLLSRNGATLWGSLLLSDLRVGDTWGYATGAPEIISPLTSETNDAGSTAVFAVSAMAGATNASPLVYQWQGNGSKLRDGGNITGSSTAALTVADVATNNAGTYTVVVSNSLAAASSSAVLTVSSLSIPTNPASQGTPPGGTMTFTVAANGIPPLVYQWQENGTNLADGAGASGTLFAGSATPTLTLANISYADNGSIFTCAITNGTGLGLVSAGASLTVGDPVFLSSPQSTSIAQGGTASFAVTVAGSAPFLYQWQHGGLNLTDGVSVSGATISGSATTNLAIAGAGYGDAGFYSVMVYNAHNASAQSPSVLLTVRNTTSGTQPDEQNVKSYGAKGDGVTDDTVAFLNAIAAAQTGKNNGIYVPMGHYVISSTLTLNGVEMVGKIEGGWPADTMPMPTLLIRQYSSPGLALLAGASVHGVAIEYDQGTPNNTNAPAISLQGIGITLSSLRILTPYDGISTLEGATPGRARLSDILILQPTHAGVQITKCYDFVQYRHIEVLCNAAMSTGPAFSFGRVDEGGYVGLVASNCAIGMQFYADTDTNPAGGEFTGSFAGCSTINCGTGIMVTGDQKVKITGGDFTSVNYGAVINGTNAEVIISGGKWLANNNQAVLVTLGGNVIFDGNMFGRSAPVANPLVWLQNCTTVTVNDNHFLPGSTGLEIDSQVQRAVIYGNSFEDGGITNNTSGLTAISANLFTASPPANVMATAGNGQVTLNWTAPLGATSYKVQRSITNGGPYTNIASPAGTNYTDAGLSNGTTYYYVLTALRGNSPSANSMQVSATPQVSAPAAPGSLIITASNGQVTLAWAASFGATNYNVKQAIVSGGPYTTIASLNGTNYTETGLSNGVTYYYVVSAVSIGGEGANSSEASATPQGPLPATPTALTATAANGQALVNWMAAPGATSYYVKRALASGGPYAIIAQPTSSTWTDLIVANGIRYFYVVSAVNEAGQSGNSSEANAMPHVMVSLSASLLPAGNELTLSWPSWATNYTLTAATNLTAPTVWQTVTNMPQSNNGMFRLNLPVGNVGQQFYRLVAP
jgi:fibronectin type 3 domain-containing protein